MNPKEYMQSVLRTESSDLESILERIADTQAKPSGFVRLLHAAMGLCTEAGKFQDALRKYFFYGKGIDKVNLLEELGNLLWYITVATDALGGSFEEVMQINHNKLGTRNKEEFSDEKVIDGSCGNERTILKKDEEPTKEAKEFAIKTLNEVYEKLATQQRNCLEERQKLFAFSLPSTGNSEVPTQLDLNAARNLIRLGGIIDGIGQAKSSVNHERSELYDNNEEWY